MDQDRQLFARTTFKSGIHAGKSYAEVLSTDDGKAYIRRLSTIIPTPKGSLQKLISCACLVPRRSVGGEGFASTLSLTDRVRAMLGRLCPCESVRKKDPVAYAFLVSLLRDGHLKIDGVEDLRIHRDQAGHSALVVVTADRVSRVSWIDCCRGKPLPTDQLLSRAMRAYISPQIEEFRQRLPEKS